MREHKPARPEDLHAVANDATRGGGAALPFADVIQRAFGRHAIGHIQAHTGAEAETGARELGAEAFAFGDHVAFASAPSLHTVAHEAAHVVQQRAGVQLLGGIGETGDRYEAHADAVADLVVRGESAETLLDQLAPASSGSNGAPAIQRKTIRNATATSVATTNGELVGERTTQQEQENTSTDRIDFAVSSTRVLATPEHDQSGWGFLVKADQAEALRVQLEARNYPGIVWQVRDTAPQFRNSRTVYKLIRPMASSGGGLALSPGDCLQKCLHTMNVQSAEAFFKDSKGHVVGYSILDAKMRLMEDAFGDQLTHEYWTHRAAYVMQGQNYPHLAELDRLMLEPYAKLNPDEKDAFDRTHGINKYASADPGQGFITLSDNSSKTENFAFHAGGVLAKETGGNDVVTWENFANWANDYGQSDSEKQAAQTDYAVFKMYSNDPASGQTFHDQIACGGNTVQGLAEARREYGNTPITFPLRQATPAPMPTVDLLLPSTPGLAPLSPGHLAPSPSYLPPSPSYLPPSPSYLPPSSGHLPPSTGFDPLGASTDDLAFDPSSFLDPAFLASLTGDTSAHVPASPTHDTSAYLPASPTYNTSAHLPASPTHDVSTHATSSGPTFLSSLLDPDSLLDPAFLHTGSPTDPSWLDPSFLTLPSDTSWADSLLNLEDSPSHVPAPHSFVPAAASFHVEPDERRASTLDNDEDVEEDIEEDVDETDERDGRRSVKRPHVSNPHRRSPSKGERKKRKTRTTRDASYDQVRRESGRDASPGLTYWFNGEQWKVTTISTVGVTLEKLT